MPRKASIDKSTNNLDAEFSAEKTENSTENNTINPPYPANNSGYLNNNKTTDVLNYYAISLGIGGYANLFHRDGGYLKVSDIRQFHANFLSWLVANNIVNVNDDMVNYITAYLSTFNNNSVV